jgi:hypothetical protein
VLSEEDLLLSCLSLIHWLLHLIAREGYWKERKGEVVEWSVLDLIQIWGP